MLTRRWVHQRYRGQRGLSIVEMMVGIAIGLIVVAAASQVVVTQLNENKKLLTDMQVQQDLRAAADIVTRELRRSGATFAPETGIWSAATPTSPALAAVPNALDQVTLTTGNASVVGYRYQRSSGDPAAPLGFQLFQQVIQGKTRGTIQSSVQSLVGTTWSDLTDSRTLNVTKFSITPLSDPSTLPLPCPKFCPDAPNSTICWPTVTVRQYKIEITAEAVSDPAVKRSIRTNASLRNDQVGFNAAGAQACPA